jgi:hypothetical protein
LRLERVPGGLRLAEWAGGSLRRRAPELAAADLGRLLDAAAERGVLGDEADMLREALAADPDGSKSATQVGVSPGRTGELRDELRVEPLGEGRVRLGRWIMRPNRGWELQDAPVMLPAARYAEALRGAAAAGALSA